MILRTENPYFHMVIGRITRYQTWIASEPVIPCAVEAQWRPRASPRHQHSYVAGLLNVYMCRLDVVIVAMWLIKAALCRRPRIHRRHLGFLSLAYIALTVRIHRAHLLLIRLELVCHESSTYMDIQQPINIPIPVLHDARQLGTNKRAP